VFLLAAGVAGCDDGDQPDADGDGGTDGLCAHDEFVGPGTAGELTEAAAGEYTAEGLVCPAADRDWYRLTVPAGDHLLNVNLYVTGPGSPIQPTYAVYGDPCSDECLADCAGNPDGCEDCCVSRAAPLPAEVENEIDVRHCLEPGDYFIVIRDQGDDNQDFREPRGVYHLTVSTEPDPDAAEPNDGQDSAAPMAGSGGTYTARGQIACRGDQDWYAVEGVQSNQILDVELAVPVAAYQPQVRIVAPDDTQLGAMTNEGGTAEPTALAGSYVVPGAGRYFVVVEDDDGGQADSAATYDLTVRLTTNTDPNEPNNVAADATDLGSLGCGGSWAAVSRSGNLAATNDTDIFRVGLSGCSAGVLEASVIFDGAPEEGLQPSIRIIRSHPETPCAADADCRDLLIPCEVDEDEPEEAGMDCAGFGNTCHGDVCAGASMCLPGGACGANIIERHPNFCNLDDGHCRGPEGAMDNRECSGNADCAPQDRISTAIPIGRGPDAATPSAIDAVYVVVSDHGSDRADPSLSYTLQVRTRSDPDTNEPNERYTPFIGEGGTRVDELARPVAWGGCLNGRISYERDRDWFVLPNPCPNANCTLSVTYNVSAGPIEAYATAQDAWDNLTDVDPDADESSNPSRSGSLGGGGDCLPSNANLDDPLYIVVRDIDLNRDFSADQTYQVCFGAITPGCSAPCILPDGANCWYPDE
jgi:hypothetical protein